ncbi:MAG: AzlD domain-containing protein [Rhodospirillales bacterium]|nr:AzlD domain-containing protein [Rhodospirillales bacterium]
MSDDTLAILAIAGMAAATYFTRASGLWLARRFPLSPRVAAILEYVPGTVIVSLIAPTVLTRSPAEAIAAGVTVLVSIVTGSLPIAMTAGVAAVWLGRSVIGG